MVIAIYPRKSVYRDNSESIAVQVQMCKDYANIIYRGKEIEYKVYDKDEGFSGKNTRRPGYQEMMADVRKGKINVVMVYRLDRICRNVPDFSNTYSELHKCGVEFVSVTESFDTSTPIGRTVMYILAAFAELERDNISQRVTDNMLSMASAGKWTGGITPTGMRSIRMEVVGKEHSYLEVDEDNIGLVKTLFELFLSGYSITKLERHCRDHNIKSLKGNFLSTSQLHNILCNPVYCENSEEVYYYLEEHGCKQLPDIKYFDGQHGLIGYGKTETSDNGQRSKSKDNWTISIGIHKPVISGSDWISVQKRLGINKSFRTSKYTVGLLKGVLKCTCGSRIDIRTYKKNERYFSYYYCANMAKRGITYCNTAYIKVDDIDQLFLRKLKEIQLNPDFIKLQEEAPADRISPKSIKANIVKLDKSIENLTKALMENADSSAASYVMSKIEDLHKERQTLINQLRQAEDFNLAIKKAADTKAAVYENVCKLMNDFDVMTYQEKNELIKKTVKSCILTEGNLHIVF